MLNLENPQVVVDRVVSFIAQTFKQQSKSKAVIAVSGGIDSAVSLTVLSRAISPENVTVLLLPYGDQAINLGQKMAEFNQIPAAQIQTNNIQKIVDAAAESLGVTTTDQVRLGNLKARARMICVYDTAKKLDALVCGTENKSEHYLGYFTRFGDAASDLEPICHLYKTQIRQIATHLQLPPEIIDQTPSAGLWAGQTDEVELGFSYQQADEVLSQYIDDKKPVEQIKLTDGGAEVVAKVIAQVNAMSFKLQVPYQVEG